MRRILENVAIGPGLQAFVYVFVGPVQGEHQYPDLRVAAFDLRNGFNTVHPRHGQIHDRQIRRQVRNRADCVASVGGLAHHLEIGVVA